MFGDPAYWLNPDLSDEVIDAAIYLVTKRK